MDDPAYMPFVAEARERDDPRLLRFFGEPKALLDHQTRLERVWETQIQQERKDRYLRKERQNSFGSGASSKL